MHPGRVRVCIGIARGWGRNFDVTDGVFGCRNCPGMHKGAARSEHSGNSDLRREGELMRSGTFFKFSGGPGPPGAAALHSHRDIALCNFVDMLILMFIIVSRGDFDDVFVHLSCACGPASAACAQMLPDVGYTPCWDKQSSTENIGARFPRFQPEAPITWSTRLRRPKPGELPVLIILPVTSGSAEADPPPWTLRRRSARVDTPAVWASSQRSTQARTRSRRLESRAQRKSRPP